MTRALAILVVLPVAATSTGCRYDGNYGAYGPYGAPPTCSSDSDCGGGEICSRLSTCESQPATITVRWTLRGLPASDSACAGIDHLEVDYTAQGQDLGGFAPVLCAPGLLHFDRLPGGIDGVRVSALGAGGSLLAQSSAPTTGPLDGETASIDLAYPSSCAAGLVSCGGGCADLANDPGNCGGCGVVCAPGDLCAGGACVTGSSCGCSPGLTDCGGVCVDTTSDPANCGGCGIVCDPSQVCEPDSGNGGNGGVGGVCVDYCSSIGLTDCNGACVDLSSDPENCGSCGVVCDPGLTCSAWSCS